MLGSRTRPGTGGVSVAVDPMGNAIASWIPGDGGWWWARYVRGSGWEDATPFEIEDELITSSPDIRFDGDGNAIAVWAQCIPSVRCEVWSSRFTPEFGWSKSTYLQSEDGSVRDAPKIAMRSNGDAVVVWTQPHKNYNSVWATSFTRETGWAQANVVEENDLGIAVEQQIDIDDNGNAIVVWRQHDGESYKLWASWFVSELGEWRNTTMISKNVAEEHAERPQIAMDSSGNAIAVWVSRENSGYVEPDIWANRFVPGIGWGIPSLIEMQNSSADIPKISIGQNGGAIAVWYQGETIWANHFVKGTGWSNPMMIDQGNFAAYSPQIVTDNRGNATVVWTEFVDSGTVWSNRFNPQKGWGNPTILSEGGNTASPDLAVDADGNVFVVWAASDGLRWNLWASRFLGDTAPPLLEIDPLPSLTNNDTVRISGRGEPGNTITVAQQIVQVDEQGFFQIDVKLPDGIHLLVVEAIDLDGNAKAIDVLLVVDTSPPVLALASSLNNTTIDVPTITLTGRTENDAKLQVNNIIVALAEDGSFTLNLGLAEGTNSIEILATDPAGNEERIFMLVSYRNPVPALREEFENAVDELQDELEEVRVIHEVEILDAQNMISEFSRELESKEQELKSTRGQFQLAAGLVFVLISTIVVLSTILLRRR